VGLKPISVANWLPSVLLHCWLSHLTCKNRPRNDLSSVEWDVKPLRTHSRPSYSFSVTRVLVDGVMSLDRRLRMSSSSISLLLRDENKWLKLFRDGRTERGAILRMSRNRR